MSANEDRLRKALEKLEKEAEHHAGIKKGHPAWNNKSIYVAQQQGNDKSLSEMALAETLQNSRDAAAMRILEERVGPKKAKKMVDEAARAWGLPEPGFKGWIKRRLS